VNDQILEWFRQGRYSEILETQIATAKHCANRYFKHVKYPTLDDLVNSGLLHLREEIHKFDPSRNSNFHQFAYPRIKNGMLYSVLNNKCLIRIPKNVQYETSVALRKAEGQAVSPPKTFKKPAVFHDHARNRKVCPNCGIYVNNRVIRCVCSHMFRESPPQRIAEFPKLVPAFNDDLIYNDNDNFELVDLIDTGLNALDPESRAVITMRFGLDDGDAKTHNAISKALGYSYNKVAKLESRALATFRELAQV
jgi:RNA polymerase nonessential primary-like sigma factor